MSYSQSVLQPVARSSSVYSTKDENCLNVTGELVEASA